MLTRLARWTDRVRRSAFAVPLAAAVAALMLLISEIAYHGAESQLRTLATMGRARLEMFIVMRRVTDAESGERGYLLTGSPDYLDPYRNARADSMASLEKMHQLLRELGFDDVEERRKRLADAVSAKLSELDEMIRLHDAGQRDRALEVMQSGIGRDQMEQIRAHADALISQQNQRIAQMLVSVFDTLQLNRIGIASMIVVSLLMLAMFLRQGRQLEMQRAAQRSALQNERDRLDVEVRHRTAELTELARHLETAREDERARLARDLHDELGALLTAAKLDVARIRPSLQQLAPDLMPRLVHLTEALNGGIALKRRIIEDLRPSTLDNLGLLPALEVLCAEAAERLGIPVRLDARPLPLAASAELTVYRMVQEALNNIAKYARAGQVWVRLSVDGEMARVEVQDDGRGFDTGAATFAAHGLLGMRYRVQAEGGRLKVQSQPGEGTTLSAWLPTAPRGCEPGAAHPGPAPSPAIEPQGKPQGAG